MIFGLRGALEGKASGLKLRFVILAVWKEGTRHD